MAGVLAVHIGPCENLVERLARFRLQHGQAERHAFGQPNLAKQVASQLFVVPVGLDGANGFDRIPGRAPRLRRGRHSPTYSIFSTAGIKAPVWRSARRGPTKASPCGCTAPLAIP